MRSLRARSGWWMGTLAALLGLLVTLTGCSTTTVVAAPPVPASEDDDFSSLIADLRADLLRSKSKPAGSAPSGTPSQAARERDRTFAARAQALFGQLDRAALYMPVVGVQPQKLTNSWGDPRDGGRRKHRGIDIFAPRGTGVVAVADGFISFIGDQPKGGHCVWLTTDTGSAFYYAHLDRWAPGLYEGMEVRSGDLLGYVGNTGNARTTPPHLHFGINENDEMVNPFPILRKASVVKSGRVSTELGASMGSR